MFTNVSFFFLLQVTLGYVRDNEVTVFFGTFNEMLVIVSFCFCRFMALWTWPR